MTAPDSPRVFVPPPLMFAGTLVASPVAEGTAGTGAGPPVAVSETGFADLSRPIPGRSIGARGGPMRRFLTLVGALMLVVLVWTSSAAHAAEAFGCIEVSANSVGHFDGDDDQVPSDTDKRVPHHHGGCSGHHVGVPATVDAAVPTAAGESPAALRAKYGLPSREPDRALRPPIA